jgi:GNAT superfamily N-acetyltransferase
MHFDVDGLEIIETIGGRPADIETMLALYAELFPAYDYYLPYMRWRMNQPIDHDPRFIERWWLVRVDDAPAGLRYFKYAPARDCALSLGIAVKPEYRARGFGRAERLSELLFDLSGEQIRADAVARGRPEPFGVGTELQLPETAADAVTAHGRGRLIERYRALGYHVLPVEYYEPPHIAGREAFIPPQGDLTFHRLMLGVLPLSLGKPRADMDTAHVATQVTLAFLIDHYGLQPDHWAVQRALESIEKHYGERVS